MYTNIHPDLPLNSDGILVMVKVVMELPPLLLLPELLVGQAVSASAVNANSAAARVIVVVSDFNPLLECMLRTPHSADRTLYYSCGWCQSSFWAIKWG